jgi:hypothetical protein
MNTVIVAGHCEGAVDGLSSGPSFPLEGAQHLPYSPEHGYQVLLPGLKFNCFGNLTSWSGLVAIPNRMTGALVTAFFQIWRPSGYGRYELVGFDEIFVHEVYDDRVTDVTPNNGDLAYYRMVNATEVRDEDVEREKQENKPLYFQPNDIVGFFIPATFQLYTTYRNQTENDQEHLVMDMFVTRAKGRTKALCHMNMCSNKTFTIESVIPNIFFTFGMCCALKFTWNLSYLHVVVYHVDKLDRDVVLQQQQGALTSDDCEAVQVEECPTPSPSVNPFTPSTTTTPSVASSSAISTNPTSPSTIPTDPTISSPAKNELLLHSIAIASGGAVIILVLGGVFIVIVTLTWKKRKSLSKKPFLCVVKITLLFASRG